MFLSNLHTHTVFCDGADTVDNMVKAALDKGFHSIGFSSHAYMEQDECSMSPDNLIKYFAAVDEAKTCYKNIIAVYKGIENDSFGTTVSDGLDYTIGSTHYVDYDGVLYCIDSDVPTLQQALKTFGDAYKLTKRYFEIVCSHIERTNPDIVGHIDIVCKFNDKHQFFDETDRRYRMQAFEVCDFATERDRIIEVNTGAMARGYKSNPYPNEEILKYLYEKNARLTWSSDAHNASQIDYFFDGALELIKRVGFKSLWEYTDSGFCEIGI